LENQNLKPSYDDDAEPLLYFLDKYTTILVSGARAMGKYYKQNKSKMLLDRLTCMDIAYSILMYEEIARDVWVEEIDKKLTCDTEEQRKAFRHVAVNKHHVKKGTRIVVFQDGWTSDGWKYYGKVCKEVSDVMKSEIWSSLKLHWGKYVQKYHKYSYVHDGNDDVNINDEVNKENQDEDCVVSLPGEPTDDDEFDLDDESDTDDNTENDESAPQEHMQMRPRLFPV